MIKPTELENAERIMDITIKNGMSEITPAWNIYTREFIEKGKIKNLSNQSPFFLNRLIKSKDGRICSFVILPSDTSGAFDIFKMWTKEQAHFQVFSILFNGEPDRLENMSDIKSTEI